MNAARSKRTVRDAAALAEAIREYRHERGMTQQDLADWIGVHRNYVIQLEKGQVSQQVMRLLDLLSILGIDIVLTPRSAR